MPLSQSYLICPVCVHAKSLHCVQLSVTLWSVAHQAPLSMGFFRQEYWSGLSCPLPGIKLMPLMSSAWAGGFFTTSTHPGSPICPERKLNVHLQQ